MGSVKRFFPQQCVSAVHTRSSKVIDFGTNRKRVCDFLLVRHSNVGPTCILHRFRDIAGFCADDFCADDPNLGVFPLDQIADVGVNVSRYLKLFGREIIFEVGPIPTYVITVPERHGQTDRQTDRQTDGRTDDILWHNRALCIDRAVIRHCSQLVYLTYS